MQDLLNPYTVSSLDSTVLALKVRQIGWQVTSNLTHMQVQIISFFFFLLDHEVS